MGMRMGMFDYVDVQKPLPDGWSGQMQSKDFDCAMTTIKITSEGRLLIERFETEEVPKAERPHPDNDGILGLMGSIRRVNRRWDDLNYHGIFNFYGGDIGDWHAYDAKFTDGVLVGIEIIQE